MRWRRRGLVTKGMLAKFVALALLAEPAVAAPCSSADVVATRFGCDAAWVRA